MTARRGRFLVAAFGDAGHAFPAIALARALSERGHAVIIETWERWREPVERIGLRFAAAEEYKVFPPPPPDSAGGASAAQAARALIPLIEDFDPAVVVSDILTLAPALAAEVAGVQRATLIPHVYPIHDAGKPYFAFGLLPPRTPLGAIAWRAGRPVLDTGLRRGRRELNAQRARLGLAALDRFHGSHSPDLTLLATLPQLEYPRRWPPEVHMTGPMTFELPHPDVELPPGTEPLILVAPSTAQDPHGRLVRVALDAFAGQGVRVIATTNRGALTPPVEVPDNARLVEWLSYSQVMPLCSLVITHGGHGTVARALCAGVPVLASPAVGDMAETAIRASWAGVGLSVPWRLLGPRALRWAALRILEDGSFKVRAERIARWAERNDGARTGAELIEGLTQRSTAGQAMG